MYALNKEKGIKLKMKKVYIGPKQSTIKNNNFFDYSLTLFGSNTENNISYETFLTFEYWNPDNNLKEITIYNREMEKVNYEAEIMAHDPYLISKCDIPDNLHLICLNDKSLLELLNNKFKVRDLFKNDLPMLKYYNVKGKSFKYNDYKYLSDTLVIQLPIGSGGSKTFICNKSNYNMVENSLIKDETYSISAYIENNIPYNIHCLIGKEQIEILPPSQQKLEIIDKIEYIGSTYNISLDDNNRNKLNNYCKIICNKLKQMGYLGILGIDFIYANNNFYFIEINPRFQGSTQQLDKILKDNNLPSIFEYNYNFFKNINMPSLKNIKVE